MGQFTSPDRPPPILILAPITGLGIRGPPITAFARALSRAFVTVRDAESLTLIALLCGVGLLVSLLLMLSSGSGLDLSPGFF